MSSILIGRAARKKIISGVKKLNGIVGLTIGPAGRNVIIDHGNGVPTITNDGVTITKTVEPADPYERLAVDIIRQASLKTNQEVGDGTTSAVVLASAIIKNAMAEIRKGADPNEIKDGLLAAAAEAADSVQRQAVPCNKFDDRAAVAVNSCANAADGKLVTEAFARVGADGLVTVEENQNGKTELLLREGLSLSFELPSPYFIDDIEKEQTVYTDAGILMTDGHINGIKDVLHILETGVKKNTPLVIMAEGYSPEFISAMLLNRVKSGLRVVPLKYGVWAGDRDALLNDIAAVTNAVIISEKTDLTLQTADRRHLGTADKIIIGRDSATILNRAVSIEQSEYIKRLRLQLKNETDDYKKTRLRERISKLESGIAAISVGCPTTAETREKRLRIEDAVHATRAAITSGIVVGGGLTYHNLSKQITANGVGAKILRRSLPSVIRAIYKNANIKFRRAVLHGNFGYNAKTNEYGDLFAAHIIDPAAVIVSVIRNAVSAAAILLTTNGMVTV